MPQTPLNAQNAVISTPGGQKSVLNITAPTIIKGAPGRVAKVIVQVAGTTTGTVNDCLTTGAAAIGNQVAVIPMAVGPIPLDFPCAAGIVVVPGTGQTLSVSYL